jgi:hypothetical protein
MGSKSSAAKALEDIADVPGVKKVVNDAAGQVKVGQESAYLGRVFQIEETAKIKNAGNRLLGVDASYTLKNPIYDPESGKYLSKGDYDILYTDPTGLKIAMETKSPQGALHLKHCKKQLLKLDALVKEGQLDVAILRVKGHVITKKGVQRKIDVTKGVIDFIREHNLKVILEVIY